MEFRKPITTLRYYKALSKKKPSGINLKIRNVIADKISGWIRCLDLAPITIQ